MRSIAPGCRRATSIAEIPSGASSNVYPRCASVLLTSDRTTESSSTRSTVSSPPGTARTAGSRWGGTGVPPTRGR
jgi:hypothetical protein